jgi:hypothetical protein
MAATHPPTYGGFEMKPLPKTEAEWCAYRCRLSCKIGRDVLDGKQQSPRGVQPMEFAIFNLLQAVEELSKQVAEKSKLETAILETLAENAHLADGDNCTLRKLKEALQSP